MTFPLRLPGMYISDLTESLVDFNAPQFGGRPPVAWFPFGRFDFDLMRKYDATAVGSPTHAAVSDRGFVHTFNGSSQYMRNDTVFGITDYPFSMMAWVKPSSTAANASAVCFTDASSSTAYYSIGMATGGAPRLTVRNPLNYTIDGTTTMTTTSWMHICGRFMSSISRDLLVNGNVEATGTDNVTWNSNNDTLLTGLIRLTSPAQYWPGSIYDVRVFDYTVSANQVQDVVRQGQVTRRIPFGWEEPAAAAFNAFFATQATSIAGPA